MKEKKLPSFVRNPLMYRFFQSRPGRILSNWVLQGMLYMNPVETGYKLFLDVVMAALIWLLVPIEDNGLRILFSLLVAHTINWLINCQPIALLRHLDWGENDASHFIEYIEGLERRIQGRSYLAAAASFGSLSKGKYSNTSDIDIRVVFADGLLNRLRAAHYCFMERFRAALHRFPLDLYAFDLEEMKSKMNEDEVPVVFTDPQHLIRNTYRETVPFEEFRLRFRKMVLGEEG
ncbi:MAG TPA: nucleotidyltransferase domain-containing protein [Gammaproteobacteria bacterium]|nr:nucleotidyltransferase domain-containing protein [Gammaproteobacteria bacterium]